MDVALAILLTLPVAVDVLLSLAVLAGLGLFLYWVWFRWPYWVRLVVGAALIALAIVIARTT